MPLDIKANNVKKETRKYFRYLIKPVKSIVKLNAFGTQECITNKNCASIVMERNNVKRINTYYIETLFRTSQKRNFRLSSKHSEITFGTNPITLHK